jgi:hypothetical protein
MSTGSDCSLLDDCPPWDWLVETIVLGGWLEGPRVDVVGAPYDGGVGVLHQFISPIIVADSSDSWPHSSFASCTSTSLG